MMKGFQFRLDHTLVPCGREEQVILLVPGDEEAVRRSMDDASKRCLEDMPTYSLVDPAITADVCLAAARRLLSEGQVVDDIGTKVPCFRTILAPPATTYDVSA
ncbi:MAG: hypothetical protein WCO52_05040 [bacterium]